MGTPPCSLSVSSGPSLPNQPCTLSSLSSVWLLLHRRCHTRTTQPSTYLLTRCQYEFHAKWPDHRLHILQTKRLQQILPMEPLLLAVLRSRHIVVLPRETMTLLPGDTITPSLQTSPYITNIIISSLPAIILSICDFNLCPPIPANKKTKMLYEMFLL